MGSDAVQNQQDLSKDAFDTKKALKSHEIRNMRLFVFTGTKF